MSPDRNDSNDDNDDDSDDVDGDNGDHDNSNDGKGAHPLNRLLEIEIEGVPNGDDDV